jgi:hypothetical protein
MGSVRFRPITPEGLAEGLADLVVSWETGGYVRIGVDGPPPARPDRLAAALVDPLRVHGQPALAVATAGFLRPASVRFERGRTNPDSFYENWFDLSALSREVLAPLDPGGTGGTGAAEAASGRSGAEPAVKRSRPVAGMVLPDLWDPATDRATRSRPVPLPPGGVLILHGPLLLGTGLALDVTVHLLMTPAALARRLEPDERWTLPAYERYAAEVAPETFADVVVRADDPDHPAVSTDLGNLGMMSR